MNIRKICILIISFLILSAHYGFAQDILTWQECVQQAKENNPDLISALEDINQASSDKDISISTMAPQVDVGASVNRSKTGDSRRSDTYAYDITGRQLLYDGFKTASEVTKAQKIILAEQYNYAVVSSNIRLDLRNAFAELMRAQDLVGITKSIAERRKQNQELVELRYESGRESKGSLLAADADLAQAEFEVAQAGRNVTLSQRNILKTIGLSKMRPWQVQGEFVLNKDYNDKPDLDLLAETTPFISELIYKKEASRYNLNSKEADFFPKVYADGSMGKTYDTWPPRDRKWSAGLSVSLPIFEGGSRVAEVSKATSQLSQAEADERSGRDSVLATLELAWKDLKDAIANVSVKNKFLVAGQERAKITRAQYAIGLATFNDWIIIEDNLVKSKKAYLNAQADMLYAEAYWVQAIGGTLEHDQEQ